MPETVIKVAEHFWRIEESGVRMFLFEGKERAMLVDTGFGTLPLKEIVSGLTPCRCLLSIPIPTEIIRPAIMILIPSICIPQRWIIMSGMAERPGRENQNLCLFGRGMLSTLITGNLRYS